MLYLVPSITKMAVSIMSTSGMNQEPSKSSSVGAPKGYVPGSDQAPPDGMPVIPDSIPVTTKAPPVKPSIRQPITSSLGTSLDQVLSAHQTFFDRGATLSLEARLGTLNRLKTVIKRYESRIIDALRKDLNKPEAEAYISEVGFVLDEIKMAEKSLKKWMAPKRIKTPMTMSPARSYTQSEPLGRVLIVSPWNYPFQLLIGPMVGAIAAGNVMTLKPSEMSVETTNLIVEMIKENFDESLISIFEGGADVSKALMDKPWAHIFFTGSTAVGRLVAGAAAKNLSPVTLELGGKSPVIIDQSAKLKIAAKRTVWGKFFNAGQTCIAPDYVLIHESLKDAFVQEAAKAVKALFGQDPEASPDFGRIINKKHFDRLVNLLPNANTLVGGTTSRDSLYISPTIVDGVGLDHPVMKEEIFGPILPVIAFNQIEEVFTIVRSMDRPLALYLFAESKEIQSRIFEQISFGGGCINDTIMHCANTNMPFGGVGGSGVGASHGKAGFDAFSHQKSVMVNPTMIDMPLRYQPYSGWKLKLFRALIG